MFAQPLNVIGQEMGDCVLGLGPSPKKFAGKNTGSKVTFYYKCTFSSWILYLHFWTFRLPSHKDMHQRGTKYGGSFQSASQTQSASFAFDE